MPASMHRRKLNRASHRYATPLRVEQLENRLMLSDIVQPIVNWGIQIEYAEPIGQTFTAEDAAIESIGFKLYWGLGTGHLTVSLYEGEGTSGPLVASRTRTLPSVADPSNYFDFDFRYVTLTPGMVYTAMLDADTEWWGVGGNGGGVPDNYLGGTWIFWGEVQPAGADLAFRVVAADSLEIELASAGDPRDPATEMGNDHSTRPAISADGRYVAFVSDASNLTPGDLNGVKDVFVKDMRTGDLALVSTAADGTQGNAGASSSPPSLSGDGRYVAFASRASNLVADDGNGNTSDVFVKDIRTGRVTLGSVSRNGVQIPGGAYSPVLTPDGRYVAFVGDGVYVKDLQTGELTLVAGGYGYDSVSISDDGRIVAYSNFFSVEVKNLVTGVVTLASSAQDGTPANSNSFFGQISGNGRYVSFGSYGDNLVASDGNGSYADIFVKDLATGEVRLVSNAEDGTPGNDAAFFSALSRDGTWIVFSSDAGNLVPGDANGFGTDFFVRNLLTGELTLLTHDTAGTNSINAPALSANGRYVAFDARNGGLVPGDVNGAYDVFHVDLHNGRAGDVRSELIFDPQQGKILVLVGDAADNDIVVSSSAPGSILVEGRFGTTINEGAVAAALFSGVQSVRIELGSGDDSVFTDDLRIDGSLNFALSDGNDALHIHRGSVGALKLDAGAGSDTVALDVATVLGKTSIRMGEGDDVIAIIDSLFADDSLADGGLGDDVLAMYGNSAFSRKLRRIRFETV